MSTTINGTTGINRVEPTAYGLPLSHRNKIINGNFQINQRGYVSGTNVGAANTYTLDRWRVVTSGQNISFTASDNGNLVTAPAGGLEQVIEGVNIEGGTYVLSWTGSATATVNGTARTRGESFTLTANTNTTVRFSSGTVGLVQLEVGSVASPFEHRPYGTELALCQRYYESGILRGETTGSAYLGGSIQFAAFKRANPTLVLKDLAGSSAKYSTSFSDGNSISVGGMSSNTTSGAWLDAIATTAPPSGTWWGVYWTASAEL